jgi:hypothetical protein
VEIFDGCGKAVSHFSKKYRGLVARWILTHQEGDPCRVLKGHIPGCRWSGVVENDIGGMNLRLVVDP